MPSYNDNIAMDMCLRELKHCTVLLCNDSAPLHLAMAVNTPVAAIFGATVPEFGFAPYGNRDIVIERRGMSCRPCSTHGGERCPIKTFNCMSEISPEEVLQRLNKIIRGK